MSIVIVSGSAGLVGSESVKRFALEGYKVVSVENGRHWCFFGEETSTLATRQKLIETAPHRRHHDFEICNRQAVGNLFRRPGKDTILINHAEPERRLPPLA